MSPHGILTEPSLSPHVRKGREGKGREKEVGHPCLSSHWGISDRPLMDEKQFGGGW